MPADSELPPAVILAHGPGGLGAARSLGRRGVRVLAVAFGASEPVVGSRWPARTYVLSPGLPEEKERELIEILLPLGDSGPALLCTSDRMIEFISRNREILAKAGFRFLIPPDGLIRALNDKVRETRLIGSLGFPVPKTVCPLPPTAAGLEAELGLPVILKPISFVEADLVLPKTIVLRSRAALDRFYADGLELLPLLIAQEVIPGEDGASWVCSCTFGPSSQLLDCAIKRKIRMAPAHFGPSTIAVSAWNAEVHELTRRIGQALGYVGHAGVEFRQDFRDGLYKYIEINPRIPANVELDEASGVPTVWNSYAACLGRPVSVSGSPQREGVFYVDLLEDIYARLIDQEPLVSIIRHHLTLLRRRRSGQYFAWDDPLPGLLRSARFVRRHFPGFCRWVCRRGRRQRR